MANYRQVINSEALGRRQFWYICGPEKALVQDALELAKDHAYSGVSSISKRVVIGSETTGSEITSILLEGTFEERTVVILLDAEKLVGWDLLSESLSVMPKSSFLIAVSNEDTVDTRKGYIRPFIGSQKSRFVLCKPLKEEEMLEWLESRLIISKDAARYLAARSCSDHEWLLNATRKLQMFQGRISLGLVEKVIRSSGSPRFSDSVLHYRKREAIVYLRDNKPPSSTVSVLTTSVRKAFALNEAMKVVGQWSRPLIDRTHLTSNELNFYRPVARLYDRGNILRCFGTLYKLYPKLLQGNKWAWQIAITRW